MKFMTQAEMYLSARKRKFENQGRVECKKHKGQYYDPKIYKCCYACAVDKMGQLIDSIKE